MAFRRGLAALHRWIGLATGTVVFVVSLSGAVFVWERELFALWHADLVHVRPAARMLAPEQLIESARGALPSEHPITRLTISGDSTRAAVVETRRVNAGATTFFGEFAWYEEAYVDQYTGRVLGVVDKTRDWLLVTRYLHTSLLLAEPGSIIVGISTIVFVVMCLIGLVLWWPRNWKLLPSRLTPRVRAAWKRVVFDTHNIFGFYGLVGLLIVAITGPVWTFPWYTNAIAWTLTGEARLIAQPIPTPAGGVPASPSAISRALARARALAPNAERYMIDVPPDESRVLIVGAVFDQASLWEEFERYYFHPATGELLGDERFEEKNLAMKWRNSNYGIHTATLFGWPMQVAGTLVSLLAASLPVTGLFIWYPRWRRRRASAQVRGG